MCIYLIKVRAGYWSLWLIILWIQITQLAIELAMDHKPSHREMTSVLISDLYGVIISEKDIANGNEVIILCDAYD